MCDEYAAPSRRTFLNGLAGAAAATSATGLAAGSAMAATDAYADPENPSLPSPGMTLDLERSALVVIDPQIDFLSPKGAAWPVLGESVTEHKTVQNLARLFKASKNAGITVAISPQVALHDVQACAAERAG
jgi:isochorismate hydrolase